MIFINSLLTMQILKNIGQISNLIRQFHTEQLMAYKTPFFS